MKKKLVKLIPPDLRQCQAEKPNGHSFMTLGGVPGRERCKNPPAFIATEACPGFDGRRGSMSLCRDCKRVMLDQMGVEFATFARISKKADQPTGGHGE